MKINELLYDFFGGGNQEIQEFLAQAAEDGITAADVLTVAANGETTDWVTPTLVDGWSDFGNGFQGVRYRKYLGEVIVEGLIVNDSGGDKLATAPIFTLPAGFRPPASQINFSAVTYSQVSSAGVVSPNSTVVNGAFMGIWHRFIPEG